MRISVNTNSPYHYLWIASSIIQYAFASSPASHYLSLAMTPDKMYSGVQVSTLSSGSEKPKNTYEAKRLPSLLAALQNRQASGILRLETVVKNQTRAALFVVDQGRLVFGGDQLPTSGSIATLLRNELGGDWTDLVLASQTEDRLKEEISPQVILNRLVSMHLLSWDQVETTLLNQIAYQLEAFLPYAGSFIFKARPQPPITRGFTLNQVMAAVSERVSRWAELVPYVNSGESIPHVSEKGLHLLSYSQADLNPKDLLALQRLHREFDGHHSIFEIASSRGQDPLLVACEYLPWFQKGWLVCGRAVPEQGHNQLTILVVDDSALMQQLIRRILGEHYRVLLASTAMEALGLLSKEDVGLMLLDVSMPGIDGLELCRSIRKMSKFNELPIVMVTARDGFFDKVKGRMAGATEYLTKPFESESLRQVVGQYLPAKACSN